MTQESKHTSTHVTSAVGDLLAPAPSSWAAVACVRDLVGGGEGEGAYQAALGTTWHHCVSTRLTMYKVDGAGAGAGAGVGVGVGTGAGAGVGEGEWGGGNEGGREVGVLRITKSPWLAVSQWPFDICATGVRTL